MKDRGVNFIFDLLPIPACREITLVYKGGCMLIEMKLQQKEIRDFHSVECNCEALQKGWKSGKTGDNKFIKRPDKIVQKRYECLRDIWIKH